MINKLIVPIIVILIIAVGIGAYFVFQKPTPPKPSPTESPTPIGKCGDGICGSLEKQKGTCPLDCKPELEIIKDNGTIKYIEVEGGFYGIVSDKGENYDPINLPKTFKEDGLKISFEARKRTDMVTIHMWGIPVEIIRIKKLGDKTEQCLEDWQCGDWSVCQNNKQTRTCTDLNNCGTTINKPSESQSCEEPTLDYENSPFGAHPSAQESLNNYFDERYTDIGVKWIRYASAFMAWDIVERKRGSYDWTRTDRIIAETGNNVNFFFTINSYNRWDQPDVIREPKFPNDVNGYLNFLKAAVERYDGDSINDAPGSPIVNYWQVENEVDGNFWADTPEKFAELLKLSYNAIKEKNPKAKVLIGGASIPRGFYDFYVPALNSLDGRYFDIMDVHWYEGAGDYLEHPIGNYKLKEFIQDLRNKFNSYGYGNIPIWFTEIGTYGGQGVVDPRGNPLPEQDEGVQAAELVKRYVYFISNGVSKVFWYQLIEVHHTGIGTSNDAFENVGLINNPQNSDGLSHKKLAYYTYKKMIEVLEGSDWSNIQKIQESGGVFIYKFTKNGNPIWVAWNDNSQSKQVTISGVNSNQVKIIEAVPKYESGKDVTDYSTAFNIETKTVNNKQIQINLGQSPVFVEEE